MSLAGWVAVVSIGFVVLLNVAAGAWRMRDVRGFQ